MVLFLNFHKNNNSSIGAAAADNQSYAGTQNASKKRMAKLFRERMALAL
jgi:hypothetical protein